MKKIFLILLTVWIGLFIILSVVNLRDEYSTEKALWKLNRHYVRIAKNPESVPHVTFEKLANEYRHLIKKYSHSQLRGKAQIILGTIYLIKKDYSKAREEFGLVKKNYPDAITFNSEALSAIARSYEIENNWPKALETYRKLIKEYPKTVIGFSIPIYIARYYEGKNQKEEARVAYHEAIQFYRNLAKENPNSGVEYNALRLIGISLLNQKNWPEGLNVLTELLLKYPNLTSNLNQVVPAINTIAIAHTKNYDVPISIYKKFIETYPKHPINNTLKVIIENFEKLKIKNSTPTATQ